MNPTQRRLCLAITLVIASSPLLAQRVRVGSSSPSGLVGGANQTTILFCAGTGANGAELWTSDDTAPNTAMLVDVYPGPLSSYPEEITRSRPNSNDAWFVARAPGTGRELHHFPALGTTTTLVKDIRPGNAESHPRELTLVGNRLFFVADDGTHGSELWTSDGTVAGTRLLRDIVAGAGSSMPFGLTAFQTLLVFSAQTATNGYELWISDGTTAGTRLLSDIWPGATSSTPAGFTAFGNRLYFSARSPLHGRELWSTDGTATGTRLEFDIDPGLPSSSPEQLTPGNGLAFTARTRTSGRQLYLRGQSGPPSRISNLTFGESIHYLTAWRGQFWFRARTAAQGYELWKTGPVALVNDLVPGAGSSMPSHLEPLGGALLFRANALGKGKELWSTTGGAPTLVQDIRTGSLWSSPSKPVNVGASRSFFAAKDGVGVELWSYTGTPPTRVRDIDPDTVLPEQHLETTPAQLILQISGAAANRIGIHGFSPLKLQPPVPIPGWSGALAIDVSAGVILPFLTGATGTATTTFALPAAPASAPPVAIQSLAPIFLTSYALTSPASCTAGEGTGKTRTTGGAEVKGLVCVDDESGETTVCLERTDSNTGVEGHVGMYKVSRDGTAKIYEIYRSFEMAPGDVINHEERVEFRLPQYAGDPDGSWIEIYVFETEPNPTTPPPSNLVCQSYC